MARKKELTKKKVEKYLKRGSGNCPRCNSESIDGESFDMDGREVMQEITCISCGLVWLDTYMLVGCQEIIQEDEFDFPSGGEDSGK